jgi:hypothetical protein
MEDPDSSNRRSDLPVAEPVHPEQADAACQRSVAACDH